MKIVRMPTREAFDEAATDARQRYAHVIVLPVFPFDSVDRARPWAEWVREELDHPDLAITLTSAAGFLRDHPTDWPDAIAIATDSAAVAVMVTMRSDFD